MYDLVSSVENQKDALLSLKRTKKKSKVNIKAEKVTLSLKPLSQIRTLSKNVTKCKYKDWKWPPGGGLQYRT